MSTVAEINSAIKNLTPHEIQMVGHLVDELREELWDEQIETDAKAGRLDKMIAKAKAGFRAGRATPFP